MTPFPALPQQLVSGDEGMTTPRAPLVVVDSEHQTIAFAESACQWTSVAILLAGSCPCNRPDDSTLQQKVTVDSTVARGCRRSAPCGDFG